MAADAVGTTASAICQCAMGRKKAMGLLLLRTGIDSITGRLPGPPPPNTVDPQGNLSRPFELAFDIHAGDQIINNSDDDPPFFNRVRTAAGRYSGGGARYTATFSVRARGNEEVANGLPEGWMHEGSTTVSWVSYTTRTTPDAPLSVSNARVAIRVDLRIRSLPSEESGFTEYLLGSFDTLLLTSFANPREDAERRVVTTLRFANDRFSGRTLPTDKAKGFRLNHNVVDVGDRRRHSYNFTIWDTDMGDGWAVSGVERYNRGPDLLNHPIGIRLERDAD